MKRELIHGDCVEVMRSMEEASVDAIVTDPPYGLGFMGKTWDSLPPGTEVFKECLRVLKPGGHLLAFGGSRTYHRLAVSVEDAGFEIRDQIMWVYGSGFPKSLDVSKAIDKRRDDRKDIEAVVRWLEAARVRSGVTRQQVEDHFGTVNIGQALFTITPGSSPRVATWEQWEQLRSLLKFGDEMDSEVWRLNGRKGQPGEAWTEREVTGQHEQSTAQQVWMQNYSDHVALSPKERKDKPATLAAQQWQGWGTALKPAHEPIVMARKPLLGTVAENVLAHGTGALNIDEARIGNEGVTRKAGKQKFGWDGSNTGQTVDVEPMNAGRWPANLIHDGSQEATKNMGDAARYFYCAKASKRDRNEGLEELPLLTGGQATNREDGFAGVNNPRAGRTGGNRNTHPTVKPTDLMRYLVRLVTPPGGTVLDPFTGSGSTGKAAALEGFAFVGIEKEAEYVELARARIEHVG